MSNNTNNDTIISNANTKINDTNNINSIETISNTWNLNINTNIINNSNSTINNVSNLNNTNLNVNNVNILNIQNKDNEYTNSVQWIDIFGNQIIYTSSSNSNWDTIYSNWNENVSWNTEETNIDNKTIVNENVQLSDILWNTEEVNINKIHYSKWMIDILNKRYEQYLDWVLIESWRLEYDSDWLLNVRIPETFSWSIITQENPN